MENYVYNKLIEEISVNDDTCDELFFYRSDLEREQLHSSDSYSFFGMRVPPRETTTLLNVFKIVSDNLKLPNSFYHDYTTRQLYRFLCLSRYLKGIENYKKVVKKNFLEPEENMLITDENDELIVNTGKKLKEMYGSFSIDDDIHLFENLKELTQLVLNTIDEYDELQNVWYFNLPFRKVMTNIKEDDLDKLIYTCIETKRDSKIIHKDFILYTGDRSSCVSNIIGMVYFCYEILSPYSIKISS